MKDWSTIADAVSFIKDARLRSSLPLSIIASSSAAEISASLPASPAVGDSIKIKAMENCGASRLLTIERAGSHTIDGATSIQLKSPHAAVECVYVAANLWKVF